MDLFSRDGLFSFCCRGVAHRFRRKIRVILSFLIALGFAVWLTLDLELSQTHKAFVVSNEQGRPMPLRAYVLTDNRSKKEEIRWTTLLKDAFELVSLAEGVRLKGGDIRRMLGDGIVSAQYRSWYVSNVDPSNVTANWKFPHELGCLLAHVNIWRMFLEEHQAGRVAAWAMVLEDDVILRGDFAVKMNALRATLPYLSADYILIGHCNEKCQGPYARRKRTWRNAYMRNFHVSIGGDVSVVRSQDGLCTHAYLVSAEGAQRLLNNLEPISMAIDEIIKHNADWGKIDSLSVCPPIARQPWQNEEELLRLTFSVDRLDRGNFIDFVKSWAWHLRLLGWLCCCWCFCLLPRIRKLIVFSKSSQHSQ